MYVFHMSFRLSKRHDYHAHTGVREKQNARWDGITLGSVKACVYAVVVCLV